MNSLDLLHDHILLSAGLGSAPDSNTNTKLHEALSQRGADVSLVEMPGHPQLDGTHDPKTFTLTKARTQAAHSIAKILELTEKNVHVVGNSFLAQAWIQAVNDTYNNIHGHTSSLTLLAPVINPKSFIQSRVPKGMKPLLPLLIHTPYFQKHYQAALKNLPGGGAIVNTKEFYKDIVDNRNQNIYKSTNNTLVQILHNQNDTVAPYHESENYNIQNSQTTLHSLHSKIETDRCNHAIKVDDEVVESIVSHIANAPQRSTMG